ncbi:hypothetical protein LPW36_05415 [Jinshanibacter sp. LJY008]|uniref:Uncharacterized protein n=1 Tax=Limnobaculum eriocheiris TaxID=2897391 RepID=A0A9X1MX94_9GAMM|nr:hypothetical protein [Limnobaculum eriocheiris]MCD1125457.1 hypothetical protein [Limnobaculum eriocheiris]
MEISIMGNYGKTAIDVVNNYLNGQDLCIAWNNQIRKYTCSESSIKKPCPKHAFLGLCEAGLVIGIPKGTCPNSNNENKIYALSLYRLLKGNLTLSPKELHRLYEKERGKSLTYNSQADVVISLFREGLLN